MDRIISSSDFIYSVQKVGFHGKDAIALQLVDQTSGSTPYWLMYFPGTKSWFEWTGPFHPINDGRLFLGNTTKIYEFATGDNWSDDGSAVVMTTQFRLPKKGNNRESMSWCALDADNSSAVLDISFSDDDYSNFSTARSLTLNSSEKRLTRCGSYKQRAVKLVTNDNGGFEVRLRKFLARIA